MSAPVTTWKVDFYKATTDPATSAYDTLALATIAGYSGYATATMYITSSGQDWEFGTNIFEAAGGALLNRPRVRKVWSLQSQPYTFVGGTDPDLDDLDTIKGVLAGSALWMRVTAGSRTYPSTASTAHPIIITGWSTQRNDDAGTRRVTITAQHKYII